jgi:hypothetical protein
MLRRKTLRVVSVEFITPSYDPHPEKSTTNNYAWRKLLAVILRDNYGNTFDWIPRWNELEDINKKKFEIEQLNKDLLKQQNE